MDMANHGMFLLQQLNSQREFGFLCDCTVSIGDVYFKAHKAVLASFSNYFKMLFIHQTSDCVKLKPADIQPDIFSYLLHLMYTGKIIPQMIDPVRLEQGLKFLHAYPLLQEASLATHGAIPQPDPYFPWPSSLYGIQLARSQACLPAQEHKTNLVSSLSIQQQQQHQQQHQPQPLHHQLPPNQQLLQQQGQHQPPHQQQQPQIRSEHDYLSAADVTVPISASSQPPPQVKISMPYSVSPGVHSVHAVTPTASEDPSKTQPVGPVKELGEMPTASTPSLLAAIQGKRQGAQAALARCYVCHICGRRFNLRSSLREHLYLHTGVPYPQSPGRNRGRGRGRGNSRQLRPRSAPEGLMEDEDEEEGEDEVMTVSGETNTVVIDGDGSYRGGVAGNVCVNSEGASVGDGGDEDISASPFPDGSDIQSKEGGVSESMEVLIGFDDDNGDLEEDDSDSPSASGGYQRIGRIRKFVCNVCGRRFAQRSHCKEHMYIHTGKPYSCLACNKTFSRANQATRHTCNNEPADPMEALDVKPPLGVNLISPEPSSRQQDGLDKG
uniref:Zinc finger and BTB domain containing 2b n=1 Tax=Eptatretus burgeri TaxID=7764 RepID=A0A8C4NL02_EPTBU